MTDTSDAPVIEFGLPPDPKPEIVIEAVTVTGAADLPDDVKNGEVPGPDTDDGTVTHTGEDA